MQAIIPIPKTPITVRPATMDDLPFIDQLQKMHTKQVGWMPEKALVGKITAGHVIVAEEELTADFADNADKKELDLHSSAPSAKSAVKSVGYCIGHDQYFKRDDVGIIYQMNVLPGRQRGFVGATLLKAQFERSAYGCKLYCCWCAQDIEANRFWESLGFIPLAFRAGSAKKSRVHIFWQRRIRAGDETTPYWFPSQTSSGAIREDRLVLPIPPGTHWRDVMPIVLPGEELPVASKQLPVKGGKKKETGETPVLQKPTRMHKQFTPPSAKPAAQSESQPPPDLAKTENSGKPKRQKRKNDPKLIAAARELRDRWLERVNEDPMVLQGSQGKYEVSRTLSAVEGSRALEANRADQIVTRIVPALPATLAPAA